MGEEQEVRQFIKGIFVDILIAFLIRKTAILLPYLTLRPRSL
jgi:hypothetical protein